MIIALIIISISLTGYLIVEFFYKRMLKREELEEQLEKRKGKLLKRVMGSHYDLSWNDINRDLDELIKLAKRYK